MSQKKHKSHEELILSFMQSSQTGGMHNIFIMYALETMAKQITSKPRPTEKSTSIINNVEMWDAAKQFLDTLYENRNN